MEQQDVAKFFREYFLSSKANEYIVENIRRYGVTFGTYLLKDLNITTGKVIAYAPLDVNSSDPKRLENFEKGYLLSSLPTEIADAIVRLKIQPDFDFWLTPIVQDHLSSSDQNVCVFTDIDIKVNHPNIEHPFMHTYIYSDEVYYILTSNNSTENEVDEAFNSVGSWSLVCSLTSCEDPEKFFGKRDVSPNDFEELALNTEKIIVMAYDGESYLVWYRS